MLTTSADPSLATSRRVCTVSTTSSRTKGSWVWFLGSELAVLCLHLTTRHSL